jgi:hypothetical protein
MSGDLEESYEHEVGHTMGPKDSFHGRFLRAENGLNFFMSATGSFLYLLGSIFFIPSTGLIVAGTIIFIPGSAAIFLSQSWKVWRQGLTVAHGKRTFELSNYKGDVPALCVDAAAGLGGLAYCIGSILFLPSINTSDTVNQICSTIYVIGGLLFFLSGVALTYRYWFTKNFPHEV